MEIILRRLLDNINKANSREQVIHLVDGFDISVLAAYDFNKVLVSLLAMVESISIEKFVWFLEALYQSKNKKKFDVFCYLFYEYSEELNVVPRIEKIKLPKSKFVAFLPTMILSLERANNRVAISVLLVLINNYENYKFGIDEKRKITKSIERRLLRILEKREKSDGELSNSDLKMLEVLIDVAKWFNNDLIFSLIIECLKIQDSEVLLFSIITLLINDIDFDDRYILTATDDNEICCRLFEMMKANNVLKYFPMSRINQEYLAKLDMISWLEKSQEYGCAPEEIICEGTYEHGKLIYYVFKFKNSDFGREWKVGLAGGYNKNDGPTTHSSNETYSIFEKYKDRLYYDLAERILNEVKAKNNRQHQEKLNIIKAKEEEKRRQEILKQQKRQEQIHRQELERREQEIAKRESELAQKQIERRKQLETQNKIQSRIQTKVQNKSVRRRNNVIDSNVNNVPNAQNFQSIQNINKSFIATLPKQELRVSQQRLLEQEEEMREIKIEQERDKKIRQQQLLKEKEMREREARNRLRQQASQRNIIDSRKQVGSHMQTNVKRRESSLNHNENINRNPVINRKIPNRSSVNRRSNGNTH